jgi:hypothetical protein
MRPSISCLWTARCALSSLSSCVADCCCADAADGWVHCKHPHPRV